MWLTDCGTMTRYKQTEFTEDDSSSIGGIQLNEATGHTGMQIRYHTARATWNWRSRNKTEKWLLITTFVMTIVILTLLTMILSNSSDNTNHVVHVQPHKKDCLTADELPCLNEHCIFASSEILKSIDASIDPCDDFYGYACNQWIKNNPIPEGKSTWGTFGKLEQMNQLIIRNVLEKPAKTFKSEAERKAKVYYESCLDVDEHMEKLGAKPMIDLLKQIGGWNVTQTGFNVTNWKLGNTLKILHNKYNFNCLFGWAIGEDDKNSTRHVIQIDQGGLTLPTADYYNNKTDIHRKVLSEYIEYMTKVCVLLGANETTARIQMEAVINFEKKLANITIPMEDRRNEEAMYHPMKLKDLIKLAPFLNWTDHFDNALQMVNRRVTDEEIVVVYAPDFLKNLSNIILNMQKTDAGKITLNNYLIWQAVRTLTSCLSKPFRDAYKGVRKALMGSDGGEEVWRYCVSDTNNVIGFAVGAIFVRQAFHGVSKPAAEQMIGEIREAFKMNLQNLSWVDKQTRERAIEKANEISDMIGFPDYILNSEELDKKYEELNITANAYFENNIQVAIYNLKSNLKRLDQPVNKTNWGMTPQTVNAYYTPTKNQIVFPAGILQTPFFDINNPKSLNFGAMGVVMGHELTHAFDDQGREYDKFGNINRWWDAKSIERFNEKAECIANQYSGYKLNGRNLNGKQTLGENIADNGGLKAAYHAYMKTKLDKNADVLKLPGLNLTHPQLFFVSFAQVWCSSTTDETNLLQMEKDPHSPSQFRVIGTLSNMKEFADVFNCKADTRMNPTKKCEVW
ncbi:PREDICTED: endothelin-converting enzyme 1 isoform X1 [Drosophila arizonae]|uniref:Endothelin-converting enzyme 1 isoform X1 n=3 Tax=mojavensis species complex TaxID=198037 RepID=A0ABM1PRV6_DROAR|nr:PREDICTED: endothelin-converting enzyme 1 isoform X1 [Drosophila arizonae]